MLENAALDEIPTQLLRTFRTTGHIDVVSMVVRLLAARGVTVCDTGMFSSSLPREGY